MNAGISKRVAHDYAGQELENQTIQDKHYDLGSSRELLVEAAACSSS